MKKALLIGKFNNITKEISNALSVQCQVQLCSDNKEIMKGMLQMTRPDLIAVSLSGISMPHTELVGFLFEECPDIPMLAIGSQEDEAAMKEKGYFEKYGMFRFLLRPLNLDEILRCVQELLAGGVKTTVSRAEAPQAEVLQAEVPQAEASGEINVYDYIPNPADIYEDALKKIQKEAEKATILLVDDSPTLLRTMQAMLSKQYKVIFATSGTQAISTIAKTRPDLILLDYDMPVCDGKMTLEMLRSEESTKDIPVVFLTGMADSAHVLNVMSLHPEGYLLKPCSEKKMFSTIESVLKACAERKKR